MKKVIFVLALYILLPLTLGAEPSFKPWGSRVRIGDENISLSVEPEKTHEKEKAAAAEKEPPVNDYHTHDFTHHVVESPRKIYNGLQGGGYFLIRFFQVVISPQDGPSCRYRPVCSAYGRQAVEKHGALLGSMMAGDRLIRCNPYNPPGPNPVPNTVFGDD
ncbi:MAG: membrane protein insertion efficiency factor YidD [bacterium]|nr:membrane protein insertion efficiency factor YidD [bacterium]